MKMRTWILTAALALVALGGFALSQGEAADPAVSLQGAGTPAIQMAALQTPAETLSDACVWSPEAAAAGVADQCAGPPPVVSVFDTSRAAGRALVWPDDFIEMTTSAVAEAWDTAVGFFIEVYEYAFESEEPPRKAGS